MSKRGNGEGTIYQRSDGRFESAAMVHVANGERRRIRVYAKTRAEAQEALLERLDREHKAIPAPVKQPRLGDYLDHWIGDIVTKNARPLTLKTYEQIVRTYIKPLLGSRPLARLNVHDVQQAIAQMQASGQSARTIQKFRANLRSALNCAMREELIFRNVASLAQIPKWERKPIKPWSVEEAARFLDATRGHRLHVAFLLLVVYGLREGEDLGLAWDDVDLVNNTINIRQQIQRIDGRLQAVPVKTAAGRRTLPLVPMVREALIRHAEAQGVKLQVDVVPDIPTKFATDRLVNVSTVGGPIEAQNFLRAFRRATAAAGVRDIAIHHIRHTTATLLKREGVDPRDAQLILGHSNMATTQQIYQHGDDSSQRQAILAIQQALSSAPLASHSLVITLRDAAHERARCRQPLPSNDSHNIKTLDKQEPPLPKTTGVGKLESFGGATWIRTRDTRLFRPLQSPYALMPTPYIAALHERTRRHIIGLVAVNRCRQNGPDDDTEERLVALRMQRRDCTTAIADKLRSLSFPLNLVPATPLIDTKEAA